MRCNCSVGNFILAIVILVFTIWPMLLGSGNASQIVVIVAAAFLAIHSLMHPYSTDSNKKR